MYDIVLCVYERFRVDGLKRYVNDDRFRVDGDKNMRLLAFAFTIVFVWTGPKTHLKYYILFMLSRTSNIRSSSFSLWHLKFLEIDNRSQSFLIFLLVWYSQDLKDIFLL